MDNGGYQDKLLTKVTGGLHRKKGGGGGGEKHFGSQIQVYIRLD